MRLLGNQLSKQKNEIQENCVLADRRIDTETGPPMIGPKDVGPKSDELDSVESHEVHPVTSQDSTICVHTGKVSAHFISVFDNLLPDEWCLYAYDYALQRSGKPWGKNLLNY